MYTRYFGFDEKPFTLTPNPRFIFLSRNHKEAFAHLLYGINSHYGFIQLVGEVGTGKTTVLRTLLAQLQEENYRSALIVNPCMTGEELVGSIIQEFGITATGERMCDLLDDLNRFLLEENAAGRTVVLVIDEAQDLQPQVLEQVRLLSNLETEDDKLIQIVLAGQPELTTLLGRNELRQLNQRIAVRYRLRPLAGDETFAYIRHRMEVAGETGGVSFSRAAIRLIHRSSRGVPRLINIICDRALLTAYGDERRRIDALIVIRSLMELAGKPVRWAVAGGLAMMLLAVVAGWMFNRDTPRRPARPAPAKTVATTAAAPAATAIPASPAPPAVPVDAMVGRTEELRSYIRGLDQQAAHTGGFNALADAWGAKPIKKIAEPLTVPDMFTRIASRRGLQVAHYSGTLEGAVKLGLPFMMETTVAGSRGSYCLAVTAVEGERLRIVTAEGAAALVERKVLASLSGGAFHIPWRNMSHIPEHLAMGEKRYEILSLQRLLKQAGVYAEGADGRYGDATRMSVTAFQRSMGLPEDPSVGAATLAALSRFESGRSIPALTAVRP